MPSWEMQVSGDCEAMQAVRGLQVDTVGRLWVLDDGRTSTECPPKLWIFDLNKNDSVVLVYAFPRDFYYYKSERGKLHDLVLDRTKTDWLAYIASPNARNLVVFSFKRNASWVVKSSVVFWRQISGVAISPGTRARLYFFQFNSKELFSVSVRDLRARKEDPAVRLEFSGTSISRMVMDAEGVLYFDLGVRKSLFKWNTSSPFKEERLLKDVLLVRDIPFTFTLDEQGNFWITKQYENKKPRYKLLKADVGAKSYLYDAITDCSSSNETCDSSEMEKDDSPTFSWNFEISPEGKTIFIILLICLNVAIAVSLGTVIYCLLQKLKKLQDSFKEAMARPKEFKGLLAVNST
ncbi:uncharacterized protein LOC135937341 [Cloeon dipterum]|uniref:uncharacterized protein LOC135937341 n=1 Tax=Cloeon dipterum TaxID=197152 RepID=UPI0032203E66